MKFYFSEKASERNGERFCVAILRDGTLLPYTERSKGESTSNWDDLKCVAELDYEPDLLVSFAGVDRTVSKKYGYEDHALHSILELVKNECGVVVSKHLQTPTKLYFSKKSADVFGRHARSRKSMLEFYNSTVSRSSGIGYRVAVLNDGTLVPFTEMITRGCKSELDDRICVADLNYVPDVLVNRGGVNPSVAQKHGYAGHTVGTIVEMVDYKCGLPIPRLSQRPNVGALKS